MQADTSAYTRVVMGMPITVRLVGTNIPQAVFNAVFDWFAEVDARYSPFKPDSEVSRISEGLPERAWSPEIKTVVALCGDTKRRTDGYFDAYHNGSFDPSGLVKGWAVKVGADKLDKLGYGNFYIDAGGDIQVHGLNAEGRPWRVGIRNPFQPDEIIKVVELGRNEGVATSGAYIRGDHIYNPHEPDMPPDYYASVTIIGPDIYEADRFATAVFAMGETGAAFAESLPGLEAYLVDQAGTATMTTGFKTYSE